MLLTGSNQDIISIYRQKWSNYIFKGTIFHIINLQYKGWGDGQICHVFNIDYEPNYSLNYCFHLALLADIHINNTVLKH